ncbi:MAG TPA: SH3 domain-containing protein [Gemmatimonadaceae bacterium]|nr:SH3 domain-containing protein [Gemmatimonadaceae bacterium]
MRRIPLLLFILSLLPAIAFAQTIVSRETSLLTAPDGRTLATVRAGVRVATTSTSRRGATQVTVDGWIHRSALGGRRDTFPISVRRDNAVLRVDDDASSRVVARLRNGMGLREVTRRGQWVRVRRTGWIRTRALSSPQVQESRGVIRRDSGVGTRDSARGDADARASAEPRAPSSESRTDSLDLLTARRTIQIAGAPGDRAIGTAEPGARLQPIARDRGWVRVRLEGWVRDTSLVPADTLGASLSAADIRADPVAARGRAVRWEVQKISYQVADALRKDMEQNEPYLLARGPGNENALLYLALPPSLVERAQAIPSLSQIIITGRVRSGRSEPAGIPILDVLSITQK